jgi:hypothetical protein
LQYTICEVPFEIATCIVFAALVDLGGGLPRTAQLFWVCFFNCFCIVSCGESLGIMVRFSFLLSFLSPCSLQTFSSSPPVLLT